MSDLDASQATGPAAAVAGFWMLQTLWGRFTRRGEAAEAKLEDRVEGGLGDHKVKLDDLVPRLSRAEVKVEALEREAFWLRDQLVKQVAKVGELEGRLAVRP